MQRIFEQFIHGIRYLYHKFFVHYYSFGSMIAIDQGVKISNPSNISIGNHVHLQDNLWLNVIEPKRKKVLIIKDGTDIGRNCFITAKESIIIEEQVLIAQNVFISDHSHQYNDPTTPVLLQGTTKPKVVLIGAGSWIGTNVVVLPGTKIGKNCVVGANSVVKGVFPDFSLIAGTPAKIIRQVAS